MSTVTRLDIRSAVICFHKIVMKPKEIALKVNLPHETVEPLIKKGKNTGFITLKKSWKASIVYKIDGLYRSSKSQKARARNRQIRSNIIFTSISVLHLFNTF